MRKASKYEHELAHQIDITGLPTPETEHYFAKHLRNDKGHVRMFRFDFAWPSKKLAAEVDGGRFIVRRDKRGRPVPVGQHMTEQDYEKLNTAAAEGWRVLRFSPAMIRSGKALKVLEGVLMRS